MTSSDRNLNMIRSRNTYVSPLQSNTLRSHWQDNIHHPFVNFQLPKPVGFQYSQPQYSWYPQPYNTYLSTPSFPLKQSTDLRDLCYRRDIYSVRTPYFIPEEQYYGVLLTLPGSTQEKSYEPSTIMNPGYIIPTPQIPPGNGGFRFPTNIVKAIPIDSAPIYVMNPSNDTKHIDLEVESGEKLYQETSNNTPSPQITAIKGPLDLKAAYSKLIPLIERTTPNNINELFVATLIECLHHVPLDDFYILLFNEIKPELVSPIPIGKVKVDKSPYTRYKNEGLTLCYYILRTFCKEKHNNHDLPIELVHNPLLFRIKPQEIRRTFLAIKILFDTFIEVDKPLRNFCTISRPAIKNAYHFICQNLLEKYPKSSSMLPLENLEVCQSRLGRMTKLVYSRLSTRRLEKRGGSVYHYLGLTWNKNIIGDEIVHAIEDPEFTPKHFRR